MPDSPKPAAIPIDDKDWTWVLDEVCSECGFDTTSFARENLGSMLRANIEQWAEILSDDPTRVRTRQRPDSWSALEYGAHVRDVHRVYLERLGLMLREDGPHYPNWDQNITATEQRYDLEEPSSVATELRVAGEELAKAFDNVRADQWSRTGFRSDGAAFTIETFGRYFIHDPIHHVHDVLS